jgi:uroporphyrin-III C-methyltransferase
VSGLGTVWLVGAGPGAPDLLTLRAARLLEEADIVLYDALVHPDTVALATRARKIAVGKRSGRISTDQRFIDRALVEAARHHARVVRLKGGDPMLFGRAQEEIDALEAAGVVYHVVPGVTAALAAAAELRIPLTRRGVSRSVSFATARAGRGLDGDDAWVRAMAGADTGILYMGAEHACELARTLIDAGKPAGTPVAIVERASLPDARTVRTTLAALARGEQADIGTPAVLCVGEVFRAAVPMALEAAAGA